MGGGYVDNAKHVSKYSVYRAQRLVPANNMTTTMCSTYRFPCNSPPHPTKHVDRTPCNGLRRLSVSKLECCTCPAHAVIFKRPADSYHHGSQTTQTCTSTDRQLATCEGYASDSTIHQERLTGRISRAGSLKGAEDVHHVRVVCGHGQGLDLAIDVLILQESSCVVGVIFGGVTPMESWEYREWVTSNVDMATGFCCATATRGRVADLVWLGSYCSTVWSCSIGLVKFRS